METDSHVADLDDLDREWAEGRLDADEYEAKLDAAMRAGATRTRTRPPGARVPVAAVLVLLVVGAAFLVHPAVLWVAPFVVFKLAKHGHRHSAPRQGAITRV